MTVKVNPDHLQNETSSRLGQDLSLVNHVNPCITFCEAAHRQTNWRDHITSALAEKINRGVCCVIHWYVVTLVNRYCCLYQCSGPSMQPTINSDDVLLTEHISVARRTVSVYVVSLYNLSRLSENWFKTLIAVYWYLYLNLMFTRNLILLYARPG